MHIGVFTPFDNKERLEKLLSSYGNVTFEFFPYGKLEEVVQSFQKNSRFLDGYLFSGYLSYMLIKQINGEFDRPVAYLKMSKADFYKKLFQILLDNPSLDFSKVFLDFHGESDEIPKFLQSFPENKRPRIADEEHVYVSGDVYVRALHMHKTLHDEGKVTISFTRLANLVHSLEENEIPYHYFDISDESIHEEVDKLLNEVNIHQLQENQVVCGAVRMKAEDADVSEIQMLNLRSALLDFNYQENYDLVFREKENYIEIMTNYSEVGSLTNNFTSSTLLHFLQRKFTSSIHIGWGIGKTFTQARINALMACDYSYNNEVSSVYMLKDDNTMIGPLMAMEKSRQDDQVVSSLEIQKLIDEIDMTRDKVNKIFLAFNKIENEFISSSLFAETIGLSVRSANRILKEAEEKKLVIATVDSAAGLQGRPRKLYRLNRKILPTRYDN